MIITKSYLHNAKKQPAINILESENDFKIELLLPGFSKEDLQINYHKEMLTVKLDKKGIRKVLKMKNLSTNTVNSEFTTLKNSLRCQAQ